MKINKNKNKISRAAIAGGFFVVAGLLQRGISVLTTPIFTRLMTTEEYGEYNVFVSWLNILSIFITLKIAASVLQQTYVKHEKDKNIISSSIQSLSFLLSAIAAVVYAIAAPFWNRITGLSTGLMVAMFISIWANNVFEIWAQEKRTNYDYLPVVVITILTSLLKPILGIISVLMFPDMKVEARVYSLVSVELLIYSALFVKQLLQGPLYSKKYWNYSLKFAVPLIPHYLSQQVLSQTDRLMINSISGASSAGIYSLAYQISMLFTLFNTAMSNSLNPWIYTCIKNKTYYKIQNIVIKIMRFLSILIIMMILISPEIMAFFAPEQYAPSVYAIPAIAFSCLYMFMYGVFSCFEFYFEKKTFITIMSVISAVLNVILNLIFIPMFGYIAAAYTTLVCYIVYAWAHYYAMRKICKEEKIKEKVFDTSRIAIESIIPSVIGLSVMFIYPFPFIRYTLFIIIVVLLFAFRSKISNIVKRK